MGTDATEARVRPRPLTLAAIAVVALVPLALLRSSVRPVDDPDAYWHVLSGRLTWQTLSVAGDDPFGRFSTNPWVRIDWLSDLAMAAAFSAGGYPALVWLFTVLNVSLFLVLYVAARQHTGPLIAGLVALLGWMGTYASQGFRPQTVSFVLLAITLVVWDRVRRRPGWVPWWLVPLGWVWASCHGLWFLGPLVGLAAVVGLAVDRERPRGDLLRLAAVPVAALAAGALTPIGPRLLLSPFTVNAYAGLVQEWSPPDIHEPYVAVTVALVTVTALAWARATVRPSTPEVLWWLMALGWTLLYSRTVAVGAVMATPLAARALALLLPVSPEGGRSRWEWRSLLGGSVLAVTAAGFLAPAIAPRPGQLPLGLTGQIDNLPADTVIVADDSAGGWLLLEHPRVHPVIDTRTYLFDVQYIRAYQEARAGVGDWTAFLERTRSSAALLRDGDPMAGRLVETLQWTVAGRADGWVLLRDGGAPR